MAYGNRHRRRRAPIPTLRQLAYFVAVAEEGSFTQAAKRMYVAQPSLSQQIQALEREVGGDLLERLPRSVQLTSAGRAFLPQACLAVRAEERAVRACRAALELEAGEFAISTVRSVAVGLLPALIRTWHTRHPRVRMRLHEYGRRQHVEDSVRDGSSDIGIGPPPRDWNGPVQQLGWEEFVVILAHDDPLAEKQPVPLSSLSGREWVMFQAGHELADLTTSACTMIANFQPKRAVETSQIETAARLAAVGMGPALVPRDTVPPGLDAAVLTVDPPLGRQLTVYAQGGWGTSGEAFVSLLREHGWPAQPMNAFIPA